MSDDYPPFDDPDGDPQPVTQFNRRGTYAGLKLASRPKRFMAMVIDMASLFVVLIVPSQILSVIPFPDRIAPLRTLLAVEITAAGLMFLILWPYDGDGMQAYKTGIPISFWPDEFIERYCGATGGCGTIGRDIMGISMVIPVFDPGDASRGQILAAPGLSACVRRFLWNYVDLIFLMVFWRILFFGGPYRQTLADRRTGAITIEGHRHKIMETMSWYEARDRGLETILLDAKHWKVWVR